MNSASLILDFIATFAFALVGAQMAIRKGMDIAGLVFVSSVSALSGGTFRNIVLGILPAWLDGDCGCTEEVERALEILVIFRFHRIGFCDDCRSSSQP